MDILLPDFLNKIQNIQVTLIAVRTGHSSAVGRRRRGARFVELQLFETDVFNLTVYRTVVRVRELMKCTVEKKKKINNREKRGRKEREYWEEQKNKGKGRTKKIRVRKKRCQKRMTERGKWRKV
jgi:hypothetical protein